MTSTIGSTAASPQDRCSERTALVMPGQPHTRRLAVRGAALTVSRGQTRAVDAGRAAPGGLAESVYIGHTVTSAAEHWRAMGLSAMLPTLVLTDGAGAVATPDGIGAPRRAVPRTARPCHRLEARAAGRGEILIAGATDRRRSAWWESQAERHEAAVAGQIFSR
jgi:hypothetical protein